MDEKKAAFLNLLLVARADGTSSREELDLIERYRSALGVAHVEPADLRQAAELALEVASRGSAADRAHAIRMMARVACVDGTVTRGERRRLERVAQRFGLSSLEFAEILVAAEHDMAHRQGLRRLVTVAAAVAILTMLSLAAEMLWVEGKRGRAHGKVTSDRAPAGVDLERLEAESEPAVLLLGFKCDLVKGGDRIRCDSAGTGFFVSPDGHIVTCKHVIQPWKFDVSLARHVANGYQIDATTMSLYAWPVGARVRDAQQRYDVTQAYRSDDGSLIVAQIAEDQMEVRKTKFEGSDVELEMHAIGQCDLALLKARVARAVRPLLLSTDPSVLHKLQRVVVIGFPATMSILERGFAIPAPVSGEIRKIEDSLYVNAPLLPGNSGGPILTEDGRVVGVATRYVLDRSLGCCIQVHHVLALLPSVDALVRSAESWSARGERDAVRQGLDLAAQRANDAGARQTVQRTRARLLGE